MSWFRTTGSHTERKSIRTSRLKREREESDDGQRAAGHEQVDDVVERFTLQTADFTPGAAPHEEVDDVVERFTS